MPVAHIAIHDFAFFDCGTPQSAGGEQAASNRYRTPAALDSVQSGHSPSTWSALTERESERGAATAPVSETFQDRLLSNGWLNIEFDGQGEELSLGMKIHSDERKQRRALKQRHGITAGRPAITFAVPEFDTQQSIAPGIIVEFPRLPAGGMREHSDAICCFGVPEHVCGWQTFAEKRNTAPNQDVHDVVRIA